MADSSSSSSSEETPSETVAALFPIFLVAILSCFLFPITLYRIGRRFGLFSLIAGEEEDTKTKGGGGGVGGGGKEDKRMEYYTPQKESTCSKALGVLGSKMGNAWQKRATGHKREWRR